MDKYKEKVGVDSFFLYFLLGFLIILPVSINEVKIVFFLVVIVIITVKSFFIKNYFYFDKEILLIHFSLVVVGVFFLLLGILNGFDTAWDQAIIYLIWPSIYLYIFSANRNRVFLDRLHLIICIATIFIGFYVTVYYLKTEVGIWPENLFIDLGLVTGIAAKSNDEVIQSRIYAISSMIFVVPYLISYICVRPFIRKTFILTVVAIFFSLIIVFLSGRRALLLNFLIATPMSLVFQLFLPPEIRKKSLIQNIRTSVIVLGLTIFFIGIFSLFGSINLTITLNNLVNSGDATAENNADRATQFEVLSYEWSSSPIFGHGLGATLNSYARNDDKPWMYELQYSQLLFATGIVGVILYFLSILWIYFNLIKIIASSNLEKSTKIVPILTGMTAFFIANASNPYLQAYGHLWIIFLPISIINQHRKTQIVADLEIPNYVKK